MQLRYFPGSNMLSIELAARKSIESEEVYEGFVFDIDADGKVVSIEVDNASRRVNLAQIRNDPSAVVAELQVDGKVYTAEELAGEIGVTRRALNLIIRNMREDGRIVGLRPGVTVYTDQDAQAIRDWRQEHPRGRPKRMAMR